MRGFYGLDWVVTFAGRPQQVEEVPAHPVVRLPGLVQKQVGQVAENAVVKDLRNRDHDSEPLSETGK